MRTPSRSSEQGAVLILVIAVVAILAIVSAGLIKFAGEDRVASARKSQEARSLSCAEAGVQFGRRFFGCRYKTSNNWNNFLVWNPALQPPGNRTVVTGNLDGTTPGTDFEVTVEDDQDEALEGQPENPARDNNLTVMVRARCINPSFASIIGGGPHGQVAEVRMVYIPGLSDHGSAPSGSNAMEAAAGGDWVHVNVNDCP